MQSELAQIHGHLQRGELLQAETLCREAMRRNPFDATLVDILGVIARGRGDSLKAIEYFKNAAAMAPSMGLFQCHLALALKAEGRNDEARAAFDSACLTDPSSFETAYNYALFLHELGEDEAAISQSRRAVEIDPKHAGAHNNLGTALQSAGRFEEAANSYRQAIRLDPNHANAHANLGTALAEADQIEASLRGIERALKRWPKNTDVLNARVNALMRRNDFVGASAAAEAVLAVEPDHAQAHYCKGMILLADGRLDEGFTEYEWRVRRADFWPKRRYRKPRWNGEPLAGKTLLVHWEQGFGDIIQFCRYLPLLRAFFVASPLHAGARIVFDCPKRLIDLIETCGGFDEIGDYSASPPPFDVYVPLMSLPKILGTVADTIPAPVPYLKAAPADDVIVADANFKIGLTWASEHGESYRRKVMAITDFAALFANNRCDFYGLQFGAEGATIEPYVGSNVTNLGDQLGDFAHTAGVIAKMDLILSIDTYIVHLAGALNIPTWVLLPYSPDWRWGQGRADSPWYPSLRLFRQPKPGDWTAVIKDVGRALNASAPA